MNETGLIVAILTLIVTGIGVFYAYKSYNKRDKSTATQIGIGDAVAGDKIGGDVVYGNKIVNGKEK